MTEILDKTTLSLNFNGCLEAKWYILSNKNRVLIQKVEKDGVQDGRQLGSLETHMTKKFDIKHFNFDFYQCLEA